MTATREWPLPVSGVTVHVIGDLHMMDTDAHGRRVKARADMIGSLLLPDVAAHVQVGDFTNTYDPAYDTAALAWLGGLTDAPRYVVIGNHELGRAGGGDAAAAAYGMPSKNYAVDLGGVTLVVVGPTVDQVGADLGTVLLDAATLAWLDATLSATAGPCAIACHAPLYATVTSTDGDGFPSTDPVFHAKPRAEIEALLAAHPNVIAWIAGHTHTHPRNAGAVTSKTFGGHAVACVVAPALYYVGMSAQDDDPLMTAYVTFYPDRVDVRYRDHGGVTWFRTPAGALVRSVAI